MVAETSAEPRSGNVEAGLIALGRGKKRRRLRGLAFLRASPLARRIIALNLIALNVLMAGVLYLNSTRDSLALQRANALVGQAELIADVIEAQLPPTATGPLAGSVDIDASLGELDLRGGIDVFVFDDASKLLSRLSDPAQHAQAPRESWAARWMTRIGQIITHASDTHVSEPLSTVTRIQAMIPSVLIHGTRSLRAESDKGPNYLVATPIRKGAQILGIVAVSSADGEIDRLVRAEREQVLQMFVIATLVSVGLSLGLASTIANPLADLSAAAELGRDKDARQVNPGRIKIPDLTARPDEIGRLSGALRGMVTALYNRIDSNEQFAADVAHEIKNPLASLRSAVGTLRRVSREEQREKLMDVIDHDVCRLDRLVSDISNASRLDSELVKEDQRQFDLLKMLENLSCHLGDDARGKGIAFITDLPKGPVSVLGLEARLAQVFVNLITNAISFCEDGDAIRMWARRRDGRILVVIEDTGPGVPDQALAMIFNRFYSHRPEEHFGNNSGLGLAISKQIVEAHGGVIWAENIRPTDADITSDPLGARFVVGLPG